MRTIDQISGLGSPAKQPCRRRGVLSEYRGRANSAKRSRVAISRNWTANISGHNASSMTANRTVGIRLEFDVPTILVFSDRERPSAILRATFRITDVEHLFERDRGLTGWAQLLNLVENSLHVMVSTRARLQTECVEMFTGLDHKKTNGNGSSCVYTMMATSSKGIVVMSPARSS